MKKIDPANDYYWQMNELDKWTHYALHEIGNESLKTHGKNKRNVNLPKRKTERTFRRFY